MDNTLTKLIAPNSCAYCEITHDRHGSRGDGLHPAGVWTWVEPSDKLRLERMKRNRMIREGILMHPSELVNVVGMYVMYWGNTMEWRGREFKIVDQGAPSDNGIPSKRIAILVDGEHVWRTLGPSFSQPYDKEEDMSMNAVTNIKLSDNDIDNFLDPHAKSIASAEAEIKRLTERIDEIRAAVRVLRSL